MEELVVKILLVNNRPNLPKGFDYNKQQFMHNSCRTGGHDKLEFLCTKCLTCLTMID